MKNFQNGQLVITLILIMTIVLAIGLSIVQKSLVDISTSTKTEQSSRAFSAAEAGIEQTLLKEAGTGTTTNPVSISDSTFNVLDQQLYPQIPPSGRQMAFELPLLAKEEVAQVWLADFTDTGNPPREKYKQNSLDIFWGDNSTTDKAAISVNLVYYSDSNGYESRQFTFDPDSSVARANNKFTHIICPDNFVDPPPETNFGSGRKFYCKQTITGLPAKLMLIRFRLLYNSSSQPVAVQAANCSGTDCQIPPQARMIISTGTSGDIQRKVRVFKQEKIVPHYFDYALFTAGEIKK